MYRIITKTINVPIPNCTGDAGSVLVDSDARLNMEIV
jgi:hypothetical protein